VFGGPKVRTASRCISVAACLLLIIALPGLAQASCDQIPGAVESFRGAQGSVDRPFAGPNDFLTLNLAGSCTTSAGFGELVDDHVVTLVFRPPSGTNNVVVLSSDCEAMEDRRVGCANLPSVASATCRETSDAISVAQPGMDGSLRFRFPDTDPLLAPDGDGRGFTGPVTIAVTAADASLPCELTASDCDTADHTLACVDRLYAATSGCDPTPNELIPHFTALPPPNDFRDLCTTLNSECTGRDTEVRMTVDAEGNLLLPMDWSGILLGERVPFARLVRASASIEAFPGSGRPIRLPGRGFLRSLSLRGGLLPALFEPQLDPSTTSGLSLFGAADAPRTILWIGRRSRALTSCDGGRDDRLPCTGLDDCPDGVCAASTCGGLPQEPICRSDDDCAGECGPSLFDFSTRLHEGVGPVVIPRFGPGVCEDDGRACSNDAECPGSLCVAYRLTTEDPVLVDGILETETLRASVVPEGIAGRDLNGDGDLLDEVVLLSDRETGRRLPIGVDGAPGRAATLIRQGVFRDPGLQLDGDIVAFLEAEPLQWGRDVNGDGDAFDSFLRVFR